MIASVSGEEHSFIETGQPQSSDLACRHMFCLQGVPDVPREPPDEAGLMRKFEK